METWAKVWNVFAGKTVRMGLADCRNGEQKTCQERGGYSS